MLGAILGDIIGSPFEFDRGDKTKDFKLFTEGCTFTDDSVMTIAVAEALMKASTQKQKGEPLSDDQIRDELVKSMQDWGHRYPHAGYGGRFRWWLVSKDPQPYHSFGNGSAMRVSAVGWLYDTLEETEYMAGLTADVTHNHPEGIKGAKSTAAAIYLARTGASKEEIKAYIEDKYGYDLDRTLDQIRPTYHMDETCQRSVPGSIIAFLEADSYEDTVRNAVSLGGDTDTLGAIAGSIGEAYFGLPGELKAEALSRIPEDMREVVREFVGVRR